MPCLEAFAYGKSVRPVSIGDGLQAAALWLRPRRLRNAHIFVGTVVWGNNRGLDRVDNARCSGKKGETSLCPCSRLRGMQQLSSEKGSG